MSGPVVASPRRGGGGGGVPGMLPEGSVLGGCRVFLLLSEGFRLNGLSLARSVWKPRRGALGVFGGLWIFGGFVFG